MPVRLRPEPQVFSLFCLVPSWTVFFKDYPDNGEPADGHDLAQAILAQASGRPIDFADLDAASRHPDTCLLTQEFHSPQIFTRDDLPALIARAPFPQLRELILQAARYLAPPPGAPLAAKLRFCMGLFDVGERAAGAAPAMEALQRHYGRVLACLADRLEDFAERLAAVLAGHGPAAADFASQGFAGAPSAEPRYGHSNVLRDLGALALAPPQKQAVFRLERFVNCTKRELRHTLRLCGKNVALAFDLACLAAGFVHRGARELPRPQNPELEFEQREAQATGDLLTPQRKVALNLFHTVLRLCGLRSVSIKETTGEVYCKLWKSRNPVGERICTTRAPLEHESVSAARWWCHTHRRVWASPRHMLSSLAGQDFRDLNNQLLKLNKVDAFHRALLLWPPLRKPDNNRHFTAFADGVLETVSLRFTAWRHPQRPLPADLTVLKFLDTPFCGTMVNVLLLAAGGDALRLPFRQAKTILSTQQFSEAAQRDILAVTGRLRLPVRLLDVWDIMPILNGVSNTGKSKYMDIVRCFYDEADVFTLGNNPEEVFGLEGALRAKVVLLPEINDRFSLDMATLQSLICGEGVTVARKNLPALSVEWLAALFAALNALPSRRYQDSDFSLLRRWHTIPFKFIVRNAYSNLVAMFKRFEMPFFLYAIMHAYHSLLARDPTASFWALCQPEFLQARREIMAQLSLLEGFLRSPYVKPSALVRVKIELAGSTTREQGAGVANADLLFARYELEPVFAVRFPDGSRVLAPHEPRTPQKDLWPAFQHYCTSVMMRKSAPMVTQDLWEGVFQRYGVVLAADADSFVGLSLTADVGLAPKKQYRRRP